MGSVRSPSFFLIYISATALPCIRAEIDIRIDIHVGLWRKGEGDRLLEGADWVVDAIDNIDTKVDLLTYCAKNKIKVFSSMGSGAKRDPTRIQMAWVIRQTRARRTSG